MNCPKGLFWRLSRHCTVAQNHLLYIITEQLCVYLRASSGSFGVKKHLIN
jgi:hypothetical protein